MQSPHRKAGILTNWATMLPNQAALCDPNGLWSVDCCQLKGFTQYQREGHWARLEEKIPAHDCARNACKKKKGEEEETIYFYCPKRICQHSEVYTAWRQGVCKDPQWFRYTLWTKACCTAPENCSKSIKYLKESQVRFMFSLTFYKSLHNTDMRKVIHHPLSKIHYHCYLLIRPLIYCNWHYILKLIR